MKVWIRATRWLVPPVRRIVQVAVLVSVIALPVLALYTHYREARAIGDLPQNQWRGRAIRAVDSWIADSPSRAKLVDTTQGTLWSLRVAGYSLTDPLAGLEAIVSSRSLYVPLLWSLLVPVVASLLLGRVFCGWICPMNTLLELVDKCRALLRILEIRQRDVRFSLRNKYVVLAISLALVGLTGVPLLALVYPPAVISRELHLFVFGAGFGVGLYLVLAICLFELFVSRRWWCRYVCPGGALYSLLGPLRLVRVRRDATSCIECGDCVRACQFDLKPMLTEVTGMECTNCATCISGCDSNALYYSIVLPISGGGRRSRSSKHAAKDVESKHKPQQLRTGSGAADETTPAHRVKDDEPAAAQRLVSKMMTCAAALLVLAPGTAAAHHILGLPHYSYKENYPQVPTLEYPAQTGPFDVLMTSYPGRPVPGEAATIAFYIKNRETSQVYDMPVTVCVLRDATFGSKKVVHPPATHEPFDNQHKYTVTFPNDGQYVVELRMEVEGREERIPFLVVVGNPRGATSIVIGIGIGLATFLVVVRAIKRKRDRRRRQTSGTGAAVEAAG